MLYTIINTATGQPINTIEAHDTTQAYVMAYDALDTDTAETEVKVYPNTDTDAGLIFAALVISKRVVRNSLSRGGNKTFDTMDDNFRIATARILSDVNGRYTDAARLVRIMSDLCHDAQDLHDHVLSAINCGVDIENAKTHEIKHFPGIREGASLLVQYDAGYAAANNYIKAMRGISDNEAHMEFVIDGDDVITFKSALAKIMRGEKMTESERDKLGHTMSAAMQILKPTQKRIATLLAMGYSQREIARITKRNPATVNRNIAIMRDKMAEYIRDHAPQFADLVKAAEISAAAKAAAADARRTEEGKARHAKQMKATQAERAARYRARKAAAKAAAAKGE